MNIKKLVVKNFKSLKDARIDLNPQLNIIVGDNEAGKTTLLEAIHLVLSGQINGRNIQYELTPYFFNLEAVNEYLNGLKNGRSVQPPGLLIEAYFDDHDSLSKLKGTNNTFRENCPGITLRIEFDEEYNAEYAEYIRKPEEVKTIPVEYYALKWYSFAHNSVSSRSVPVKSIFIDTSLLKAISGTDRYIGRIITDLLDPKQRVDLSLSYRKLKDVFLQDDNVKKINTHLAAKKGDVTEKELSVSMDMTSRSAWETALTAHLDDIPFALTGKGEQSAVNVKLAIEASGDVHVLLIEEPENHLSFSNMNSLIGKIGEKAAEKQIIIATHSSFVLNKLGVENIVLFNRGKSMRLNNLSPDTQDYFMKLPGHDTLRLILAKKAVLVEGPSDELIVQRAFYKKHKAKPLDFGVDVISVQSLAFKRFLEIGVKLGLQIIVVTDNDGDVKQLKEKYKDYFEHDNIRICYDTDEEFPTLEPQILKANSLALLNKVFDKKFESDEELLGFMTKNKTDCALKIFNFKDDIQFPEYINNAIT